MSSRPLRLLVINWRDPNNPLAGGAEIRFVELFSRFLKKGHEVSLLCAGYPGSSFKERWNGFEIYRVGGEYTFQWEAPRFYLSRFKHQPFDLVIEMMNKVPLYTPWVVRHRLLVMVDHLFGKIAFMELPWPLASYVVLSESLIPFCYRRSPMLVYSEGTKADLIRRGIPERSIALIYNGVDAHTYFPDPLIRKTEFPSVLYLGRLKRYKRVDLLLSAFLPVFKKEPRAKLIIAGKGDDLLRLQRWVGKLSLDGAVEFKGHVSEGEKRELLRSSWILAVPSVREGWGMVSLEAEACGTPVLVAGSPGIRETVEEGVSGFVVRGNSPSTFTEKILLLLQDEALRKRLSEGAVAFSRRFQWDLCADQTMALIERLRSQDGTA